MCERCRAFAATEKVPERPKVFVRKCAWICEGFFFFALGCLQLRLDLSLSFWIPSRLYVVNVTLGFVCQISWKEIRNTACCFLGSLHHMIISLYWPAAVCYTVQVAMGSIMPQKCQTSHTHLGVYIVEKVSRTGRKRGEHRVVWKTQNSKLAELNRAVHCVDGSQQHAIKGKICFSEFTQLHVFMRVHMLGFINRSQFKQLMSRVPPAF